MQKPANPRRVISPVLPLQRRSAPAPVVICGWSEKSEICKHKEGEVKCKAE